MTRKPTTAVTSLLVLSVLSACAAKYQTTDVAEISANTPIAGIPFRVAETRMVHLLAYNNVSKKYEYIKAEERSIADPERVYTLGFDSKFLSKHMFKVQQNADGTLKLVNLTTESHVNVTLDELKGIADTYSTRQKEKQTAAEAEAEKAKTDAATLATGEITYQKSLDVVRLAEHKLAMAQRSFDIMLARGGNTPEEIIAKRTEIEEARIALRTAQIDANVAAQAAGRLELPYPGVYL